MLRGRISGSGRNGLPERKNYVYRGTGGDRCAETIHLPDPPVRNRPPEYREQANARERAKRAADPKYRAKEAARHRARRAAAQKQPWRERQAVS